MFQSLKEVKSVFLTGGIRITRFFIIIRLLSFVSILVDVLMIYLIQKYGFWLEMILIQILFFVICVSTIAIHDIFLDKGYDLLFMDYFYKLQRKPTEKKNILERFTQWILERKIIIFWIGSIWLEPDITTLLLRKEPKLTWEETLKITLPSNILCITFWSIIFYLSIQGYDYLKWLL